MARKITRYSLIQANFVRAIALIFAFRTVISAQPLAAEESLDTNLWRTASSSSTNFPHVQAALLTINLDHSRLRALLNSTPKALNQSASLSTAVITLPIPDGKLQRFRFVE